MAETSLPVLSAASVTTNVLAFALGNGTIVMQSIPTNTSGTAMVGQAVMATSIPVAIASDQSTVSVSASGTVTINALPSLATGTNAVGTVTIANASLTALVSGTVSVSGLSIASTSSLSVFSTAGTPAAVAIKASPGTLFGINVSCTNTIAPVYLKVYNVTAASVTSASSPQGIFMVPSGNVFNPPLPLGGVSFTTAMSYIITKNATATDTTAVQIGDLTGWILFT